MSSRTAKPAQRAPSASKSHRPRQSLNPDSESPSSVRKLVGQYVLGKTIGEGTFGKVKLAVHLPTGEKVAVKILEKSRIKEQADLRRVNREIKILKKARHDYIIQMYEVMDTANSIYLIMECAEGEMFDYIVKHKHVPELQACNFFHQITDGVEALHQNFITHRDLKPENLLLKSCGSGYLLKIVDFGLSNTHEGGKLLSTACGSPCYAAPEMIAGKQYEGPLVDIWSMGVILFALVCGYLPFEDQNTSLLYRKILSGEYKPARWLSPQVRDLIRKILETDPKKRYRLSDIRRHAWYNTVSEVDIPRESLNATDNEAIEAETMKAIVLAGLDSKQVIDSLTTKSCNSMTATYHLFRQKFKNQCLKNRSKLKAQSISPSTPKGAEALASGELMKVPVIPQPLGARPIPSPRNRLAKDAVGAVTPATMPETRSDETTASQEAASTAQEAPSVAQETISAAECTSTSGNIDKSITSAKDIVMKGITRVYQLAPPILSLNTTNNSTQQTSSRQPYFQQVLNAVNPKSILQTPISATLNLSSLISHGAGPVSQSDEKSQLQMQQDQLKQLYENRATQSVLLSKPSTQISEQPTIISVQTGELPTAENTLLATEEISQDLEAHKKDVQNILWEDVFNQSSQPTDNSDLPNSTILPKIQDLSIQILDSNERPAEEVAAEPIELPALLTTVQLNEIIQTEETDRSCTPRISEIDKVNPINETILGRNSESTVVVIDDSNAKEDSISSAQLVENFTVRAPDVSLKPSESLNARRGRHIVANS